MKPDDFEQRLRQQPLRPVPPGWREDILRAARPSRAGMKPEGEVLVGWRLLFARFPVAWGAFAALWIVLVSINALLAASDTPGATGRFAAGSFQSLAAWSQHSAALQQLASDDQSMKTETHARPPAMKLNSPRSERRRDWQFGEVLREPALIG